MHAAAAVLQKCFAEVIGSMHTARARVLTGAVQSLLNTRRLILMDMARGWPGAERVRAPLKRLDRLLSNPHVHQQREAFYAAMLRWLVRQPMPVILVDWCELHADCRWQLLRAAIPISGRSITVLELVFPISMKGSPVAEAALLRRLHAMMPAHATPILVTDAGFRTPWLRAVAALGWHAIGRMRNRTCVKLAGGQWMDHRKLYAQASGCARRFAAVTTTKEHPWVTDLVLYKKTPRGRVQLNRRGKPRADHTSRKARKREREPLLLLPSCGLRHLSARQIVALYAKRMQIEQSFRDLKCERFGCGFYYSLTRRPERIATLLLIHALATFVAWLSAVSLDMASAMVRLGAIVCARERAHYSLLRIGWEALRRNVPGHTPTCLWAAFTHPPIWLQLKLQIPL